MAFGRGDFEAQAECSQELGFGELRSLLFKGRGEPGQCDEGGEGGWKRWEDGAAGGWAPGACEVRHSGVAGTRRGRETNANRVTKVMREAAAPFSEYHVSADSQWQGTSE